MLRRPPALALALAPILALAFGALGATRAAEARPAKETYIFLVSRVDLAKGVPKELSEQVATRLRSAIEAHAALEHTIPKGAPDPETAPEKFKKYLKARNKRAFKMNVEVKEYSQAVEPSPKPSTQLVVVRVSLRLFAETYPGRSMAIHGDGSATVKLEVGTKVRPADREEANSAALEEAIARAIEEVIVKLREPPPSQKAKKKRRKK